MQHKISFESILLSLTIILINLDNCAAISHDVHNELDHSEHALTNSLVKCVLSNTSYISSLSFSHQLLASCVSSHDWPKDSAKGNRPQYILHLATLMHMMSVKANITFVDFSWRKYLFYVLEIPLWFVFSPRTSKSNILPTEL